MAFIPIPESGLTADSPLEIGIDAGVAWRDLNMEVMADPTPGTELDVWAAAKTTPWTNWYPGTRTPTPMGATRGGLHYNPGRTEGQIEADDKRLPLVGWQRIQMLDPTLKTNLLQTRNLALIKQWFGSHEATTQGYYTKLRSLLTVLPGEYWGNLVIAQFTPGSPLPMLYVLWNARCNAADELATNSKGETVLPVTFVGHALSSDSNGDVQGAGELWIPRTETS